MGIVNHVVGPRVEIGNSRILVVLCSMEVAEMNSRVRLEAKGYLFQHKQTNV